MKSLWRKSNLNLDFSSSFIFTGQFYNYNERSTAFFRKNQKNNHYPRNRTTSEEKSFDMTTRRVQRVITRRFNIDGRLFTISVTDNRNVNSNTNSDPVIEVVQEPNAIGFRTQKIINFLVFIVL